MLAQDKYQAVTNEIEEIQEVRKKVDDMRVKFEKIKEKIENNWSGENKDSYIRKINILVKMMNQNIGKYHYITGEVISYLVY